VVEQLTGRQTESPPLISGSIVRAELVDDAVAAYQRGEYVIVVQFE
jgi:hypothetical protein